MALVPESISRLKGISVLLEHTAGEEAQHVDSEYSALGASVAPDAASVYGQSDVVLKVQPPTPFEAGLFREGSTLISFLYPQSNLEAIRTLSSRRATVFAMEQIPRLSRTQPMDALSSQSTVSGYKAALLGAEALPKLFPMLITAAGTIAPARVFVLGAGVAGLQAIATAHRLGALVEAYDVRPAVKEQIESLGARFVELAISATDAQTAGGYARAQSEEFYKMQQQLLADHARASDVVITTALIPGKKAPILITEEAVKGMRPGSVIIDIAAEQGGNCALTEPGKTVVKYGVRIQGPLNLPSTMAPQASQLYSRNVTTFLLALLKDGKVNVDSGDELIKGTLVLRGGEVVHEPTRNALEGKTN